MSLSFSLVLKRAIRFDKTERVSLSQIPDAVTLSKDVL